MKKLMTILGVFLFASVVLTSCSDSAVTEKSTNNDMVEDSNNDTNFEKLGLLSKSEMMNPHSVLITPKIEFDILLPPKKMKN